MSATFTIAADGTYLIASVIGEHTAALQRPVLSELLEHMATTGVRRVLVDARAQQTPLSTIDAYQLWDEFAPRVPRLAKLAVVVGWRVTGYNFIENVAVNRHVNVRYFNDLDQGVEWLRSR